MKIPVITWEPFWLKLQAQIQPPFKQSDFHILTHLYLDSQSAGLGWVGLKLKQSVEVRKTVYSLDPSQHTGSPWQYWGHSVPMPFSRSHPWCQEAVPEWQYILFWSCCPEMNLQHGESETMGLFRTVNKELALQIRWYRDLCQAGYWLKKKKKLIEVSRLGSRKDKGQNIELLLRGTFPFQAGSLKVTWRTLVII